MNTNASLNSGIWADVNGATVMNVVFTGTAQNGGGNIANSNIGARLSGINGTISNWGLSTSAYGPDGSINYGVYGNAGTSGTGECYGVMGFAGGADNSIGVYGSANGTG